MTDQSIEDASRREFEKTFSHMELDKVKDAWGKEKYKHEHIESIWYGWQSARQSSQSEPVATIVQEIFDLCIQYERSCYNTGYLHLAEKLIVLAGRANSAIKIMEQPIAAPQQAIPSGMMLIDIEIVDDVLNKAYCECSDSRRFDKGEHLSSCALFDLNIERNKLSASPPAPIESDK